MLSWHLIQSILIGVAKIKGNIEAHDKVNYLDNPYTRFKGQKEEQETFFIEDPHGNVLELKTMKN